MSSFVKLKDVCIRITDGAHYSPIGTESGFPMLSVKDMRENGFDYSECKFISKKDYDDLVRNDCKPLLNDVLIAKDGSYLKHVFVIKTEFSQSILSSIGILRPNLELINPHYLKYYLQTKSVKETVAKKYVSGSALPRIILKNFGEIDILNVDLPTQQKIASVLSALDDKIELNNRINAEMEQMAKTLYDYWFVQFDFPDEEGKPYKSSGGKMVYNKVLKREIPDGWEVKKLHEIANITMGQSPSGESYNEKCSGMIFFQGSTDFGWRFPENRVYTTAPTRFAKEDDVLLSVRAPIGTMNLAMEDCCIGRGLAALNSKEGYSSLLNYQMNYFKKKFDYLNSVGTTFGSLTKDELYNLELAYPHDAFLKQFENIVSVFDKKIKINTKQNQQLFTLRDWLLPMLMNGQVKVESNSKNLSMAAEPQIVYKKEAHLNIPANKNSFAKQVLAGKIVSEFKDDPYFTHIKFQKAQYLAEHVAGVDLNLNYYRQAAGPYDPQFMHTVANKLKASNWYEERNHKFYPLAKVEQIEGYYQEYFGEVNEKLESLFLSLKNATQDLTEIIATLYAIWNDRIILKQTVSDEEVIQDFYNWSERKKQYSKEVVLERLQWIKEKGFEPKGFGYLIKNKKN